MGRVGFSEVFPLSLRLIPVCSGSTRQDFVS
jgi:hypothetical protein